jgi:hypothetical protein
VKLREADHKKGERDFCTSEKQRNEMRSKKSLKKVKKDSLRERHYFEGEELEGKNPKWKNIHRMMMRSLQYKRKREKSK